MIRFPLRWVAIGVFVLSSTVNFLDRQLLAALAPTLKAEFHLSYAQFGTVLSAFALSYALAAPVAGWFIDRWGLNVGVAVAVVFWSLGSVATGLTRSFGGLLACRAALGSGESAGMPGLGKANGMYLKPSEFAMSLAANHITISLGGVAAPLAVGALMPRYGWPSVFVVCGALGMLWVPLWLLTSRLIPAQAVAMRVPHMPVAAMLHNRQLWGVVLANALVMTVYTVWTNWTTIYFVQERHLTALDANRDFAWIPPVFATAGGFFGGWLVLHWMNRGVGAVAARMRCGWIAAAFVLLTAAVPLMPSPGLAVAAISASFFWCMSLQCNLHVIPLDLFGSSSAAFSVSMLACSYGLVQSFLSPVVGVVVDHLGFTPVCVGLSVFPLLGMLILSTMIGKGEAPVETQLTVVLDSTR